MTNLDGAADRVTRQSSERIDFYCNHKEPDTKMFAYIKFLCDNIHLNSHFFHQTLMVAVISLYQSVTNLILLDALWFKTGTGDDQG